MGQDRFLQTGSPGPISDQIGPHELFAFWKPGMRWPPPPDEAYRWSTSAGKSRMSGREMNAIIKRPMGLVAVVLITGIFAVIDLVFHLPTLLFAAAGNRSFWFSILLLIGSVIGVCEAVVCYGLWSFQKWGIKLAVPVYGIGVVLSLLLMFVEQPLRGTITVGAVAIGLVFAAIYALMLGYISGSDVKALFSD